MRTGPGLPQPPETHTDPCPARTADSYQLPPGILAQRLLNYQAKAKLGLPLVEKRRKQGI